jgi:hypothetical protein
LTSTLVPANARRHVIYCRMVAPDSSAPQIASVQRASRAHFRRMPRNSFGPKINFRFLSARSSLVAVRSPSLSISRPAMSAALVVSLRTEVFVRLPRRPFEISRFFTPGSRSSVSFRSILHRFFVTTPAASQCSPRCAVPRRASSDAPLRAGRARPRNRRRRAGGRWRRDRRSSLAELLVRLIDRPGRREAVLGHFGIDPCAHR